jgi:hypothetical protein
MDIDIYPSSLDRRRHRPRHRRSIAFLPSIDRAYPVLLSAGVFLTGAATGGAAAVFLIGGGW